MKKIRQRIGAALVVLVWILCLFPVGAAAVTGIEMDRLGSVTLHLRYKNMPVSGGKLQLCKVADVAENDGNYSFKLVPKLKSSGISLKNLDDKTLPEKLHKAAVKAGLPTTEKSFDKNGAATFSKLPVGLYLVYQTEACRGFEPILPVLVSLPSLEDGSYVYNVDASPKLSVAVHVTPTPSVPPYYPYTPSTPAVYTVGKPLYLPQTGQLNWPIPVLLCLGALLIALGLGLRHSAQRAKKDRP